MTSDALGRSDAPNKFANLRDEESDEEDWLDQCFENAARDANISPRK